MNTEQMELNIARFFGIRENLIIPNASWGLGIHECDLLVISKRGYATEIEIKISRSDLKKDKEKSHGHESNKIKNLFFAIPESIESEFAFNNIPERAGLLSVSESGRVKVLRTCSANKKARPLTEDEKFKAARLGSMRIWGLKERILDSIKLQGGKK